MIIKKYKAKTEKEAIIMAKEDLGPDAIVMNVKTIKTGGFLGLFKKTKVELTAAIDDNISDKDREKNFAEDKPDSQEYRFGAGFSDSRDEAYGAEAKNAIEEKINNIAKLLEQQMTAPRANTVDGHDNQNGTRDDIDAKKDDTVEKETDTVQKSRIAELIHRQLLDNEVKEEYADMITEELDIDGERQSVDNALSASYQKIVLKLGEVKGLAADENKPKIVFFVGNTGVGKTTTMAKLASRCKLDDKLSVAMLSVDTYRIAAIEQIKTYANILNAPMEVVYTPEDMKRYVDKYKDLDLIMVDTAGRSHRNEQQREDLKAIIDSVSEYEKEIFLVVSVTTKYSDLFDIADTYAKMFDYRIIFTKLDETGGLGSIFNLKLDTGRPLSYVTWGQNVPDDIGVINPQIIAKKLLGGE